jgi:TRAP-type C4-dicarboxylate transport system permease large subunit
VVSKVRMAKVVTGIWPFFVPMPCSVAPIHALPEIALYIPFKL